MIKFDKIPNIDEWARQEAKKLHEYWCIEHDDECEMEDDLFESLKKAYVIGRWYEGNLSVV